MRMLALVLISVCCVSLCHAAADLSWNKIANGGATFSSSGTVTLGGTIGQPDAGLLTSGTVTLSGGFWAGASGAPLTITSQPAAGTNPVVSGVDTMFSIGVGPGVTVTWNFGDGSPVVTGATVTHTFASGGTFNVTVTSTATDGETQSSSFAVQVNTVGSGLSDADGDGFPDELETALGTNPADAKSTPFGGAPAGTVQPLTVSKLAIRLNFAKPSSDSVQITGALPIPASFTTQGQTVTVDVGGVIRTFTLDSKGSAKVAATTGNSPATVSDNFKLAVKAVKGVVAAQNATFQAKFGKATFAPMLADEGLIGTATVKSVQRTVRVIVLFNTQFFQKDQAQLYTATTGKSGSTK